MKREEIKSNFVILVLFSALIVILFPNPAAATITTIGDIDPSYTGADPWLVPSSLFIGRTADANMIISHNSKVMNEDLYVGYNGRGELTIYNGGNGVTNGLSWIGYLTNSVGIVTVTGDDSVWNSGSVRVGGGIGEGGIGMLSILDGGKTISSEACVPFGSEPISEGIVIVQGPNSVWQISDWLQVCTRGDYGELTISEGAKVTSSRAHIGGGLMGRVKVTGRNSLWENSTGIYVGHFGLGEGEVTISEGGCIKSNICYIGFHVGSFGKVNITGPESLCNISENLILGLDGGGMIIVSDGGRLVDNNGYIGGCFWLPQASGNGVSTITGTNSLWQNSEDLYIGFSGDANMVISDGGKVTNVNGYIGHESTSIGHVNVIGSNSLWESSAGLYVGGSDTAAGGTGTLNISDGGVVQSGNVTIWPTGTISGDGRLIAGTIINKGTLEPGNSIGTMTIEGDLAMEPNSTLEVEVDNIGNSDKLLVTGDVDILGGTVKAISTETITGSKQYTIVEANSVTGTFDTLDTALLDTSVLNPYVGLGYGINTVLLKIFASRFDDPNIAHTDNQRAVGSALQQIAEGGGNSITTAVQGLGSNNQVRNAYDQLCGQSRPPLTPITVAGTSKFMDTVSDRLISARSGLSYGFNNGPLLAMAGPDSSIGNTRTYDVSPNNYNFAAGNGTSISGDQKWGFWGKWYGLFGDRKTEDGVPGYRYTVYGTGFGFDYQFTERFLLGITGGFSDGNVDHFSSRNKSDICGKHIGLYSNWNIDRWNFDSIMTYSYFEYDTERHVDLMSERLEGDFDGQMLSGYFETRYDWSDYKSWLVQPLASFQFSFLNLDGYTESGGSSSLTFKEQSYESYKGSLGMKVDKELFRKPDGRNATVELRGRWVHEFGDAKSSVDAHFASDPGTVFTVADKDISRDSAIFGVGFSAKLIRKIKMYFDYDINFNSDNKNHMVSTGLVYRW